MSWSTDKMPITGALESLGYREVEYPISDSDKPNAKINKGYVLRPVAYSELTRQLTGNTNFTPYLVELIGTYVASTTALRDAAFDDWGTVLDTISKLDDFISFSDDESSFDGENETNKKHLEGKTLFKFKVRTCGGE